MHMHGYTFADTTPPTQKRRQHGKTAYFHRHQVGLGNHLREDLANELDAQPAAAKNISWKEKARLSEKCTRRYRRGKGAQPASYDSARTTGAQQSQAKPQDIKARTRARTGLRQHHTSTRQSLLLTQDRTCRNTMSPGPQHRRCHRLPLHRWRSDAPGIPDARGRRWCMYTLGAVLFGARRCQKQHLCIRIGVLSSSHKRIDSPSPVKTASVRTRECLHQVHRVLSLKHKHVPKDGSSAARPLCRSTDRTRACPCTTATWVPPQ